MVKTMYKYHLGDVEWGEFSIKEIFVTHKGTNGIQTPTGSYIKRCKFKKSNMPRITVRETNNGIDDFVFSVDKNFRVYKNFISVSFLGGVFYHPYEASIDMKVHALIPKNIELNRYNAQFLINAIKNNLIYSSYGNQLSSTDLPRTKIMLPVDDKGSPEWHFMEEYIKERENKQRNDLKEYYKNRLLNLVVCPEVLTDIEWGEFRVKDLFEVKSVKGKTITNYRSGTIPYVTTSSINNGISDFIDTSVDISFRNCISVDPIGGKTFYHEYEFVGRGGAGSAINLLYSDKLNHEIGKFICSAMEKTSLGKASYAVALNGDRLKNAKLLLPIAENGKPNWTYMENFIKSIEKKQIKNVLKYLDEYIYNV